MERMLDATAHAEDRHFWFIGLRRNAKQVLDRIFDDGTSHRIADCGSGTGRNLDWLRAYGQVVGVEFSPAGLAHARRQRRPVVRGSVTHLPLADDSVDLATSFDVLYCLDDAEEARAISEMFRVLKPGGAVLINVPALDMLRGSHSTLTHEVRRYTPADLRRPLERAGFEIQRLTFTCMATFPLTLAVRIFDRLTGRALVASDAELRVPVAPINATLGFFLLLESALLRVTNLPVGTSVMCVARKPADHTG